MLPFRRRQQIRQPVGHLDRRVQRILVRLAVHVVHRRPQPLRRVRQTIVLDPRPSIRLRLHPPNRGHRCVRCVRLVPDPHPVRVGRDQVLGRSRTRPTSSRTLRSHDRRSRTTSSRCGGRARRWTAGSRCGTSHRRWARPPSGSRPRQPERVESVSTGQLSCRSGNRNRSGQATRAGWVRQGCGTQQRAGWPRGPANPDVTLGLPGRPSVLGEGRGAALFGRRLRLARRRAGPFHASPRRTDGPEDRRAGRQNRYEAGKMMPSSALLAGLGKGLDVSLDFLKERSGRSARQPMRYVLRANTRVESPRSHPVCSR